MCLPDHESLLSLCEDLLRMGEDVKVLKPPCVLCRDDSACWFCKSFEERAHG